MTEPGLCTNECIFNGEHCRCQWAISTPGHQPQFVFIFEIPEKCVMPKDAGNAGDTFRSEHIFIDHDGIILRIVERDRLQVEYRAQDGEIRTDPVQGKA